MDIGDCKKRVVDRRSPENRRASAPDTFVSPSPNRRVKGRRDSGSWAESGGLDDVTAALPETLDLSGQADLSTEALRVLLLEHPRTCILKLNGCMVSIPAHPCMPCCQQDSRIAASKTPLMKCCQQGSAPSLSSLRAISCGMIFTLSAHSPRQYSFVLLLTGLRGRD